MSIFIQNPNPHGNRQTNFREFYGKATNIKLNVNLLGVVRIAGYFAAFPFAISLPSETGQMRIEVIDTLKFNEQGLITEMKAYLG
jgi:steroid delta-isomerase